VGHIAAASCPDSADGYMNGNGSWLACVGDGDFRLHQISRSREYLKVADRMAKDLHNIMD